MMARRGPMWAHWMVTVDECRQCGCLEPPRRDHRGRLRARPTIQQRRWLQVFNAHEATVWARDDLARARREYPLRRLGFLIVGNTVIGRLSGATGTANYGQLSVD